MVQAGRRGFLAKLGQAGVAALARPSLYGVGLSGLSAAAPRAKAAGKKITGRLVLDLAEGDPRTKGVHMFADLVAKYTDNDVEIQIFPNDVLATEAQAIRLMRDGSLSMATVGGALAGLDPMWSFVGLPLSVPVV